jgi:hypothetical protein
VLFPQKQSTEQLLLSSPKLQTPSPQLLPLSPEKKKTIPVGGVSIVEETHSVPAKIIKATRMLVDNRI